VNCSHPLSWLRVCATLLLGEVATASSPADPDFLVELARNGPENVGSLVGLAEQVLASSPDNFFANYVIAQSTWEGGALAAALRRFDGCEALLDSGSFTLADSEVEWASLIHYRIAACLGAMDKTSAEQERLVEYLRLGDDRHEAANRIQRPAINRLVTSLLKTGNLGEARHWASLAEERGASGYEMEWVRLELYEDPTGDRAATRLKSLIRPFSDIQNPECPFEYVLYQAFLETYQGHMALAEGAYQTLVSREGEFPDLLPPPGLELAQIQLAQGRFDEARESLIKCWTYIDSMSALEGRDATKLLRLRVAQFFLGAGYPEHGWDICQSLLAKPVRFGSATLKDSSGWRVGLLVTALACISQMDVTGTPWITARCQASDLRTELYRELDAVLRDSSANLDLFSSVDIPIWMWPHLRAATSAAMIGVLNKRFGLHGARLENYQAYIGALAGEYFRESSAIRIPSHQVLARRVLDLGFMPRHALRELRLPPSQPLSDEEIRKLARSDAMTVRK